jgi:hypothetical protein
MVELLGVNPKLITIRILLYHLARVVLWKLSLIDSIKTEVE